MNPFTIICGLSYIDVNGAFKFVSCSSEIHIDNNIIKYDWQYDAGTINRKEVFSKLISEKFNIDKKDIRLYSLNMQISDNMHIQYYGLNQIQLIKLCDDLYYADKYEYRINARYGSDNYSLDHTNLVPFKDKHTRSCMDQIEKVIRENDFNVDQCIGAMQYYLNGRYFIEVKS